MIEIVENPVDYIDDKLLEIVKIGVEMLQMQEKWNRFWPVDDFPSASSILFDFDFFAPPKMNFVIKLNSEFQNCNVRETRASLTIVF